MVRIIGFHPIDPGSSPGVGVTILLFVEVTHTKRHIWELTTLVFTVHDVGGPSSRSTVVYTSHLARVVQGGTLKLYCVRTRGFKSHR